MRLLARACGGTCKASSGRPAVAPRLGTSWVLKWQRGTVWRPREQLAGGVGGCTTRCGGAPASLWSCPRLPAGPAPSLHWATGTPRGPTAPCWRCSWVLLCCVSTTPHVIQGRRWAPRQRKARQGSAREGRSLRVVCVSGRARVRLGTAPVHGARARAEERAQPAHSLTTPRPPSRTHTRTLSLFPPRSQHHVWKGREGSLWQGRQGVSTSCNKRRARTRSSTSAQSGVQWR